MKNSLTKKDYVIGYTELTLAQFCVGINVISGKFLIGFFPVFLLLAIRFAIGFIGMMGIARMKNIKYAYAIIDFHPTNISVGIYGQLLIYGISGGIMFFLLWYRGLTKINANTAALFTGVMPVSTTVLAFIFLNEPLNSSEIIGMILVIIAIFIGCKKHVFFKNKLSEIS